MSEPKRATFTTISTQKGDVKKVKETSKSIRFFLTLPESNEKSCPEYNYRDLLNSAEKKNKVKDKTQGQVNGLNHIDPFDDDDDSDVRRLAKQFEEKYGGVPNKKKRRGKKDDYADIGAGYDESDSFIDNTDAYDEMVPEDVTTVHGGFYINSGALEFKQVELSDESESSDSEDDESVKGSTSRKRIIEDSDESDSEEEKEDSKTEHAEKKQKIETNGVQKTAKKKLVLSDNDKEIPAKKKKIDENLQKKKAATVKELLREKREEIDIPVESETPVKEPPPPPPPPPPVKLSASSTITDTIESVINAVKADTVEETSKDSSSSDEVAVVSAATSESESSRDGMPSVGTSDQAQEAIIPTVKLPENLPNHILDIVNNIKKAAENSEGKVKFFSGSVNNMLLSLEVNCRKLGKSTRLQVYEHLAPFVKCKKDTLMRRAKNLLLDQERSKLKEPLSRLKAIIETVMPIVKNNYESECQKYKDEMFYANAASSENGDINSKVRRAPRKKFLWSEEARKTLQDIIVLKKKCFTLEGIRKETFEENVVSFLKSAVVPLWPEGWMTINVIMKQGKLSATSTPKQQQPPLQQQQSQPKLPPKQILPMSPISLDIHAANVTPTAAPYTLSPVKNVSSISPSSSVSNVSGITVIPIPQPNTTSPKSTSSINGPKLKHHHSSSATDLSVTTTTTTTNSAADLSTKECGGGLLVPTTKSSVTITSVDLRTNNTNSSASKKDVVIGKDEEKCVPITEHVTKPVVKSLPRVLMQEANDDVAIIDLTESPLPVRKPGPKSKTRYVDVSAIKPVKRLKESEEISGTQALNHLITDLAKYGSSNTTKTNTKENQQTTATVNEDDMEQVMKDLKELQQLQEHARKNDIDIMAPSSSPVSVIAFNSSYKLQANDLSTAGKDRKPAVNAAEGSGFQDIFQKHLFQEATLMKTSSQPSSVYNSNVQPKTNYNSVNSFSYSTAGNLSNSMNNIRHTQSSSKYNSALNHLPTNPSGATNHTDDFALFQNFLYQYGFHNTSGSKQKSPP